MSGSKTAVILEGAEPSYGGSANKAGVVSENSTNLGSCALGVINNEGVVEGESSGVVENSATVSAGIQQRGDDNCGVTGDRTVS